MLQLGRGWRRKRRLIRIHIHTERWTTMVRDKKKSESGTHCFPNRSKTRKKIRKIRVTRARALTEPSSTKLERQVVRVNVRASHGAMGSLRSARLAMGCSLRVCVPDHAARAGATNRGEGLADERPIGVTLSARDRVIAGVLFTCSRSDLGRDRDVSARGKDGRYVMASWRAPRASYLSTPLPQALF